MNRLAQIFKIPIWVLVILAAVIFTPSVSKANISTWETSASITPKNSTDFSSSSFRQSLADLKATGVKYVTYVIYYRQANIYSTTMYRSWNTPTDESLVDAIKAAHDLGLKTSLKIHIDSDDGRWRGSINPSDRNAWFTNYGNILKKYAQIARDNGVSEMIIGTELRYMSSSKVDPSNTQHWNNIINDIKSVYSGKLTYSAQWSGGGTNDPLDEKFNIGFWDKLDSVGISAYWPIAPNESNPSLETIKSAWEKIDNEVIKPLYDKFGKKIIFTEVGYRSVNKANQDPYSYWRQDSPNPDLQSRLYEGVFQYWSQKDHMNGVHIWEWETNPNAGGTSSTSYTPQNKPAEETIKEYLTGTTNPDNTGTGSTNPPAPAPEPNATYNISGSVSKNPITKDENVNITVNVTASETVTNKIVDIEIYRSGTRVFQRYYSGQNFTANTANSYTFSWSNGTTGTYTVKVGIFSGNWSTLYRWHNGLLTIDVVDSSSDTTPPPPPPPDTSNDDNTSGSNDTTSDSEEDEDLPDPIVEAINPDNTDKLSGTVTFQAWVKNWPLDKYKLYWRLEDSDELHEMSNGSKYKEDEVDLTTWTGDDDTFNIRFVAKDLNGNTLDEEKIWFKIVE